jgi:hypothetical protein
MTLPTFLVIGAMKAGTTSLWGYLREHPDVFMADEKEPEFFVEEKAWSRGPQWYASLFEQGAERSARGEASTSYTKHPFFSGVPERIAALLPDVRLVYVLRQPVERIVSQYRHALRAGWEKVPLERALEINPQYVDISSYAAQLDRYTNLFARNRILTLLAEDLRKDRLVTMQRVFAFLGVDDTWTPDEPSGELHAASNDPTRRPGAALVDRLPGRATARRLLPARVRATYHRLTALDHPDRVALSPDAHERLVDRLRPDLERLPAIVGDDVPGFDAWGLVEA